MKKSIAISFILAVALLVGSVITAAGPEKVEAEPQPVEKVVVADTKVVETPVAPAMPDTGDSGDDNEWYFYNTELQGNGDEEDDFNFGPAAWTIKEDFDANAEKALATDAELRLRVRLDPALGAADMAWFDAIMGTRYLGLFYDECEGQWDQAINQARQIWMDKPEKYQDTLDTWFEFLDSAKRVEIREVNNLTDQMYMNPYTSDGVPDVIVMETDNHVGTFLVYTFVIKGTTTKEVMYRLECGFQPTNVAEVMKVKPSKRSGGGAGGSGGGAIVSGGGGKKNPKPDPKDPPDIPKYKKDPKQGTKVLPNDDQGPGENTNNPDDPNHSTKDQAGNSTNMTQDQYNDAIGEINDANSGGGGSEPSTPPPSEDTHQDDNGGNLDSGTETSDSSVSGDESAGTISAPD